MFLKMHSSGAVQMEVPTFFSSSLSNRKPEAGVDVSWDNPTTNSASAYLKKITTDLKINY